MITTTELEQMRKDLHDIDNKLLKILETRVNASVKIQGAKESSNFQAIDSEQEKNIITNLISQTSLDSSQVTKIFRKIIDLSKAEFQKEKDQN